MSGVAAPSASPPTTTTAGTTARVTSTTAAAVVAVVAACACVPAPPLAVAASTPRAPADGATKIELTATLADPVDGAVVQWTANGGLLASSATPIVDRAASNTLTAILERELGDASTRVVDVVATVALSDVDVLDARVKIVFAPPDDGPALVRVVADPPGADADGAGVVDVVVRTRRVPAGAAIVLSTTAGALADDSITIDDLGVARTSLVAPDDPATAVIEARATGTDGDDVTAAAHVLFVAPGAPRFDLTGTWVLIAPARARLTSSLLAPNPQCVVAPSYLGVVIEQTGLDLHVVFRTCRVTFPPISSIAGTITNQALPSFYDAIPTETIDVTLPSGALGVPYEPPPSIVVAGADLEDPENDDLPTDADDPRVTDPDSDGEPGVTVLSSLGGEQRIVYRNIGFAKGRVRSSNLIEGDEVGDLVSSTETSVLGLGGAFLPTVEGLPSVVEIVRIDGRYGSHDADADRDGTITCDESADAAPDLARVAVPDTPFDCVGVE